MGLHNKAEESTNRLRRRLFFYLATALLVIVCASALVIFLTIFDHLKRAEDDNIAHIAETRSMAIAEWFRRASDLALQITSRTRIRQELKAYNQDRLSLAALRQFTEPKLLDAMNLSSEIVGIRRLDTGHRSVAACGEGARLPLDVWPVDKYIFDAIKILPPLTIDGRMTVVVSAPISDRQGVRQGTDLVILDTRRLSNIAGNSPLAENTPAIFVGYRSGSSIATFYPLSRKPNESAPAPGWTEAVEDCMMKAVAGQSGFEKAGETLMAYRPIAGTDWGLIAAQPQRELYQSLYREVAVIGLSFLVIYLITLFGFWSALKPLAGKILLHAETLEKRIQDKTAILEKEIAERKRAVEQHRTGEARYRNLFMSSADAIYVNHENRVAMVNAACLQLFGAPSEAALIGKSPFDLFHPDFHAQMRERIHRMRTMGQAVPRLETRILRLDGSAVDVEVIAAPFSYDDTFAIHVILRDITDRKRHEAAIEASLAEKEVLLKEIHHRVKNNMQVISSLVSLQANEVKDPVIHGVLQEVCHRVQSMALVHEKLYQSADFARVDFADYVQSLLGYLWRAHKTPDAGIRLNTHLEPISLPVNLAVPCALILNELFNNALKHAFVDREEGVVSVSLDTAADNCVRLMVSDDGQGLPPDFDWRKSGSLGLRLVQMLAGQIQAQVAVDSDHGTRFTLTFARKAS